MTYPQPPGGQNPYGQPPQFPNHQYGGVHGGFGPPPPKKKAGVLVAIIAIVVLVGGLGITGFVAPGFFLSAQDEDGEPSAEPTTTEQSAPETEESVDEPTVTTDVPSGDGTPTAGGEPVDQAALAAMQSFLDSVNAGDAAQAKAQLCTDGISTAAEVDELIGYQPTLEIDPAMDGITSGDRSVQLYMRGTAKGQEIEGYSTNLWVTSFDGPWCVHAFRVVVI